ncbi:unnamed protein product, partial [Mesorhabditis belari]|uniref:UDP-glucuronosyltransferase n=1 Tax=Mesorhabditis belari TaxID=2138241 RepID=A0AAF3JB42_9BILA
MKLYLFLLLFFVDDMACEKLETLKKPQKRIVFQGMHASDSHIASSMPFAQRWHQEGHYIEFLETHEKPESYNYPAGINHTYIQLKSDVSYTEVLRAVWSHYFGAREKDFDLLVIDELFSILGFGLALKRKAEGIPYVTIASCASTHVMTHHLALGNNFIGRPAYFSIPSARFEPKSFWSRVNTFRESLADFILVHLNIHFHAQNGVKHLGLDGLQMAEVAKKASFYLYEELTMFNFPQPVGTETLHVGFHCPKFGELKGDYLEHVNHPGSQGTILIAFGTNVKWEFAPIETIKTFVDAVNDLTEFRIIWTYTGDAEHVKDVKSHVRITKWAPQKEILIHPKTVAFVSHGGMKSVKDTICAGVPVVFMPILAEQTLNAEMCRQAGFGFTLEKDKLTPEILRKALKTATTESYKQAMTRFRNQVFYLCFSFVKNCVK